MTNRAAVYRHHAQGPWEEHELPGPMPQAVSRKFPTSRTQCTCGHAGPAHKRQTHTKRPWGQDDPLRFRGECTAWIQDWRNPETWGQCHCTWFIEDLDTIPKPQPKRKPGRPRKVPLSPREQAIKDRERREAKKEKQRQDYYRSKGIVW